MQELDRRDFLRRSALAGAGVALLSSPLLAACGSDSKKVSTTKSGGKTGSGSGGTASLGTLTYQLSWIKNTEFAGQYLADSKGYYKESGFDGVNLLSGGPTVQQDAVVASGKAFVGISSPDITASAILKGAPTILIGAIFQKNPFAVMSLAKSPINTPKDLIGKKIGVQSTNESVWKAFLKANKIDESKVTLVPAQFDPQPLVAGEVDGWFSFITNEPNLLKVKGVETTTFLLNDYGYPLVSQVYVVQKDALTKDRDKLKALMKAEIKGWHDAIKDPSAGPKLVVSKYGNDLKLDVPEQTLESKAQNKLIVSDETKANGIFTVSDKLLAESMATLKLAGVDIAQDKLFDLSLIDDVYKENPELKSLPA
ncbi:MAG: ABC transporter substrate-binding protein [Actinomycetota bacterium]|nr:ABC transporter substrate-binding protein [Actinomycetota bacterium]